MVKVPTWLPRFILWALGKTILNSYTKKMKIMIHSQFSIAPNKRNKVCSLHLWNDQQYNENKQTFTNCWRGALGFLDVVSRILGSFSAANAYSSSMWVFGTEFNTSQSIKTHKFTKHNNYWTAQIRENMMCKMFIKEKGVIKTKFSKAQKSSGIPNLL
jgi:hypothetical protein